jgi:hypothetical protein
MTLYEGPSLEHVTYGSASITERAGHGLISSRVVKVRTGLLGSAEEI